MIPESFSDPNPGVPQCILHMLCKNISPQKKTPKGLWIVNQSTIIHRRLQCQVYEGFLLSRPDILGRKASLIISPSV